MKNRKKLLLAGVSLSLCAVLFGCSKEEEAKKETTVEETATSESEAKEKPAAAESEETTAATVNTESESKETSTIPEEKMQEEALKLIKADYEAFLSSEDERNALGSTYHSAFIEEDKQLELPKLVSNLEAALDGKKINDLHWTTIDTSVHEVLKSQPTDALQNVYGYVLSTYLSTSEGGIYLDNRTYYVKEYNNQLEIIYIQGYQPSQKVQ
jgi:hypothetical protein